MKRKKVLPPYMTYGEYAARFLREAAEIVDAARYAQISSIGPGRPINTVGEPAWALKKAAEHLEKKAPRSRAWPCGGQSHNGVRKE